MKTHQKQKEPVSHTIQSKPDATKQASPKQILQRYQEETAQRQELDEDELLQGKFETTQREAWDEDELLQGKFKETTQLESSETSSSGDREISQRIETDAGGEVDVKPNNTGLPDDLKTGIENLSGYSMDDVQVHYNSNKPAQLQALAYTQGTDIHIAPGQEKHLPHEAWHVVQQKQGRVQPTLQLQGVNVNDNEGLEKEADVMGGKSYLHNSKSEYKIHNQTYRNDKQVFQFGKSGAKWKSKTIKRNKERDQKYQALYSDEEPEIQKRDKADVYKGGAELEYRQGIANITFGNFAGFAPHSEAEVKELIRLGLKGLDINEIKVGDENKSLSGENWDLTVETSTGTTLDESGKIRIALELILGGSTGASINKLLIAAENAANGIKTLENSGPLIFLSAGNKIRDNIKRKKRKVSKAEAKINNTPFKETIDSPDSILSKDWSVLSINASWDSQKQKPQDQDWGLQITMAVPIDEIDTVGKALSSKSLRDSSLAKPIESEDTIWDAYDILNEWNQISLFATNSSSVIDYSNLLKKWKEKYPNDECNFENKDHVNKMDLIVSNLKLENSKNLHYRLNYEIKSEDSSKSAPSLKTLDGLAKVLAAYVRGMNNGKDQGPKHNMRFVNKNPLQDIILNAASTMSMNMYCDLRDACVNLILTKDSGTAVYNWKNKSLTVADWGQKMKSANIDLVALYDTAYRSSQIGGLSSLNDVSEAANTSFKYAPIIEYRDLGSKKPSEMKAVFEKIKSNLESSQIRP